MERVSPRSHPVFQTEHVGTPLPHIVETTGAKLPSAANVGALTSALIARDGLTDSPQRAYCDRDKMKIIIEKFKERERE